MSEEKTQIFRGDEPPEMAIAETSQFERKKRLDAPIDPRGLRDQKDGEHLERSIKDASGGPADDRRIDDADGLSELRQLHGQDARGGNARLQDTEGPADQRRMEDGEGASDLREMRDRHALIPESGGADAMEPAADAEAPMADTEAAPEQMSDPDLTFKVDDDATPWALSIHLEERIASLGVKTTKVKQQLDRLDESIQRLAKRIAR